MGFNNPAQTECNWGEKKEQWGNEAKSKAKRKGEKMSYNEGKLREGERQVDYEVTG